MENNLINASLSTQSLIFRPGTNPASFTVTVNNDSNQFASFQVDISAAGEQRNTEYRWYKLEPELAATKPPGSSTDFQVFILNTPIPGFVGAVDLKIRIFSPQLGQERRLLLRLTIERDNQPTVLSVELPVRAFQVYPRNAVDVPVRVRNLSQQATNAKLRFVGVDSSWLNGNVERKFALEPGGYAEVAFQCQPPSVIQSPSQNYPFSIEATSNNGYPASATGNIEVLPVGFVEFDVPQKHQKIPSQSSWLPQWKSDTAAFELIFKNASNLYQEVNVSIQGRDWRKCTYNTVPETANLHLGETSKVTLNVKTKRPWVGIGKTLLLEAKAELLDQRLGTTDPATQTLELRSLPIIPLWLQLVILGLIALLLALLLGREPIMHTRFVNSVAFSGNALLALSGSDDCTLRLWKINNGESIAPADIKYSRNSVACDRQQEPQGLLAITDDAVQVSRFMPVENNRVAIGLDSGVIELRNVPNGETTEQLQDQQDSKAKGDRVFDLAFTKNSLYLFSGYGSGKLRLWSRTSVNNQFQPQPQVINLQTLLNLSGFQIRALTLSPDDQTLVIAGNFKRFLLWSWNPSQVNNKQQNLSVQSLAKIDTRTGSTDYVWGVDFAPNSPKILATSDSAGYITIWNLAKCQTVKNISPQNAISEVNCQPIDSWQVMSKTPVRTLKFSEDGSLLVSGGDDGRVTVWYLTTEYKLDKTKAAEGQTIYQSTKGIRSVDLKDSMVLSGDENRQVKLHRVK
ncbi:WD-40 repeat-containing protein [Nostoc sp. NIES-2111]|nr:WD-40 repeat-containing protein [Nostoc sp. NIES-2111]